MMRKIERSVLLIRHGRPQKKQVEARFYVELEKEK
jgi:hypothetical protein